MLDALHFVLDPPSLIVLGGVVAAVAAFARLFRRPGSNRAGRRSEQLSRFGTAIEESRSDPFDAFLRSLGDDWRGD